MTNWILVCVLRIRIGFNPDPDPAFFVNADLVRDFVDQEFEKYLQLKNLNFLHFCGSFWPPPPLDLVRIRIPNADSDPQHWYEVKAFKNRR